MARLGRLPLEIRVAVGVALLLWGVLLAGAASPAWAATFTVDRTDDPDPATASACTSADNDCSLRGAIIAANTAPGADTITVPSGDYRLTIEGFGEDQSATGDLDITEEVTINGAGAETTSVSAADLYAPVFHVDSDATMRGLTVSGGSGGTGGGILNSGGALTLNDSAVSNNAALNSGGGIHNDGGAVTLTGSTVSNNIVYGGGTGGGIQNDDGGTLTLTDSTVSNNVADDDGSGGGIANGGILRLTGSTVSDNSSTFAGGGISSTTDDPGEKATIVNSTISGNAATNRGGGVSNNGGLLTIRATTITRNIVRENRGAGVASEGHDDTTRTVVGSSIIAANNGTDVDIFPGSVYTFESDGYNVIGDGDTSAFNKRGDRRKVRYPRLGALADNGGPTRTHAVEPDSPALNAIPSGANGCGTTFDEDQRGVARPQGARCDIGAFERRSAQRNSP